jgi:hypothetical protein
MSLDTTIMRRRRSNRSLRRYACSTLLFTVCANAISAIGRPIAERRTETVGGEITPFHSP